jgi:hypothetical protein
VIAEESNDNDPESGNNCVHGDVMKSWISMWESLNAFANKIMYTREAIAKYYVD